MRREWWGLGWGFVCGDDDNVGEESELYNHECGDTRA